MKNIKKIEDFLVQVSTTCEDYELVECLKAWEVGSPEWEEGAMILFKGLLLYPLSQVVEYLRRGRQIDDYIDHIALLKAPEMVKKEEVFNSLKAFQADNEGAVQRVLSKIYKENEVWDTLDSAIKGNNLRLFEEQVGGDDRLQELKKITCHYSSIVEGAVPLYRTDDELCLVESEGSRNDTPNTSSLEDMKQVAKEILTLCAKLMLSTKEELYIKQIYNNPLIKNELSIDVSRYYYRIREKKATIPKKVEEQPVEESQPLTKEFYTKQETLELLDVCPTTLYNWREKKLIPRKIGRKIYYLKSDVEKAMMEEEK